MRHAHDPREALMPAVNDTWHSDTIAAIVGAAVGAVHGAAALLEEWRNLSMVLRHFAIRIQCSPESELVAPGGLIQTAAGSCSGCGGLRTKRSGWASSAAWRVSALASRMRAACSW